MDVRTLHCQTIRMTEKNLRISILFIFNEPNLKSRFMAQAKLARLK